MNGYTQLRILLLVISILLCQTTFAGSISGLSVQPASVSIGTSVAITILGNGNCTEATLGFGDGPTTSLKQVSLPFQTAHSYAKAGTMTVTATGVSGCSGQASATVQVNSNLAALCAQVDCIGLASLGGKLVPCTTPKITAVYAPAPLEPGMEVILNGECFGLSSNELRLVGNFPNGHIKVEPIEWHGNLVHARVPMVTGVMDSPAKLQVVRKDLKVSNAWPLEQGFRATREVLKLKPSDVSMDCSHEADANVCQLGAADDCCVPAYDWTVGGGGTLYGAHYNGIDVSDDCGTDRFSLKLRNGWVLEKHKGPKWWTSDLGDFEHNLAASGFAEDSASSAIKVKWCIDPENTVVYKIKLYAIGPAGVPYR